MHGLPHGGSRYFHAGDHRFESGWGYSESSVAAGDEEQHQRGHLLGRADPTERRERLVGAAEADRGGGVIGVSM
jgi:hypothetical protein